MIVAKSKEWAFLLLQGNLVLMVWRDLLFCSFWEIWWSKCDSLPIRELLFLFLFSLNESFTTKEGGWVWVWNLSLPYYIVPTLFYIFVLGNKMGYGYFCLKLLHTISNQNHNNVYYIWGWDLRTPLPILKVDWKQTCCLFC